MRSLIRRTLQIYVWEIPRNHCIFEIPRKVVFFEIFLHWFKCTNYSLYDMIFFPKIQLEITYIHCTQDGK